MPFPSASESDRLRALGALGILDTPAEPHFDAVCRIARDLFGVPIAVVSLVDEERLWFKARCGVDEDSIPRPDGFCVDTIASDEVHVVEDALAVARLRDHPLVTGDPGIRFYAGAPLILHPGVRVGALCLLATEPRRFSQDECRQLQDLAEIVVAHMRLHEARFLRETEIAARHRSDAAFKEAAAILTLTLDTMDQGLMMVDAQGIVRVCNGRAITLLGLPAEMMQAQPAFEDVLRYQLEREEFTKSADTMRQWVMQGGLERQAHTYERERPDGTVLEIRTVPLGDGSAVRTYTDITQRKQAEARLAASQERLAFALDSGSDGLWDWDVDSGAIWLSDRWWKMLGYQEGEVETHIREWFRLVHPDDERQAKLLLKEHCDGLSPAYECEYRLRTKAGEWAWVLARGKVVSRDAQGRPLRIVGTHIDVSSRKAAESRIAHMARHDALTDLPNRTLLHERLEQMLAEVRRYGGTCAVLCLDLDRFKSVNDTLGHLAGDALLRATATRLRGMVRAGDTIARLGGDEFVILLAGPVDQRGVGDFAGRLIEATQLPVLIGDKPVAIGLSIGIAFAQDGATTGQSVYKNADLALYRAKAEGRNTYRFFEPAMDEAAAERQELELDLRRAITAGDLEVHYQPQVRSLDGELSGFEALVRWRHPTRGFVPPSIFIALAEETGLIASLGEWVLRTACHEAARWPRPIKVAVNLSPRQFQQTDLPEVILAILAEAGLSPARLDLEITETVIINDMARALNILRRLKGIGIGIAMDDFGTGYSSLATLQAFPFDKIKIDRSFVGRIGTSPEAAVIVRAVLGLGRSLGMAVVAEGVETPEQMRFLSEEACEEVQGYLLGKPQPIEHFSSLIEGAGLGVRPREQVKHPQRTAPTFKQTA